MQWTWSSCSLLSLWELRLLHWINVKQYTPLNTVWIQDIWRTKPQVASPSFRMEASACMIFYPVQCKGEEKLQCVWTVVSGYNLHTIKSYQSDVYRAMVFSKFRVLHSRPHNLVWNISKTSKGFLTFIYTESQPPSSPQPEPIICFRHFYICPFWKFHTHRAMKYMYSFVSVFSLFT